MPAGAAVVWEMHGESALAVALHPRKPWLLAALSNGCVDLWDYELGTRQDRYDAHSRAVHCVDFHPNAYCPLFATGGGDPAEGDGHVKIWDTVGGHCVAEAPVHEPVSVCFHTTLPWAVIATATHQVVLWDWRRGGQIHVPVRALDHPRKLAIVAAALRPDAAQRLPVSHGVAPPYVDTHPAPATTGAGWPAAYTVSAAAATAAASHPLLPCGGGEWGESATAGTVGYAAFHQSLPVAVSGLEGNALAVWRTDGFEARRVGRIAVGGRVLRAAFVDDSCVAALCQDRALRICRGGIRACSGERGAPPAAVGVSSFAAHPLCASIVAVAADSGILVLRVRQPEHAGPLSPPHEPQQPQRSPRTTMVVGAADECRAAAAAAAWAFPLAALAGLLPLLVMPGLLRRAELLMEEPPAAGRRGAAGWAAIGTAHGWAFGCAAGAFAHALLVLVHAAAVHDARGGVYSGAVACAAVVACCGWARLVAASSDLRSAASGPATKRAAAVARWRHPSWRDLFGGLRHGLAAALYAAVLCVAAASCAAPPWPGAGLPAALLLVPGIAVPACAAARGAWAQCGALRRRASAAEVAETGGQYAEEALRDTLVPALGWRQRAVLRMHPALRRRAVALLLCAARRRSGGDRLLPSDLALEAISYCAPRCTAWYAYCTD